MLGQIPVATRRWFSAQGRQSRWRPHFRNCLPRRANTSIRSSPNTRSSVMLGNVRISVKLMAMAVVAFLGIFAVAWIGLMTLQANLIQDREAKLRDTIRLAVQDIDRAYQNGVADHLADAEIQNRIKSALRDLRYGNDDYFFAYDSAGVSLVL